MKTATKLFIGTVKESKKSGVCSMRVWNSGKFFTLPVSVCEVDGREISHHRIILDGLLKFLRISNLKSADLTVYTECRQVAFEYMVEYKTDHEFCSQTHDQDLWNEIVKLVNRNHITLVIHDNSNTLTGISKIQRGSLR